MSDPQSRPVAKAEGRDLGDEYLFYDRDGDRVHVLNDTAREIFLLCDGSRTAGEVATAFAAKHEAAEARDDALRVLEDLARLGVIAYD